MEYLVQDFGKVNPPPGVGSFAGGSIAGIPILLNIILRTLIILAAIYAILNIILAGYEFISAGGDSKRISDAWGRIWQSLLGVIIAAGAFVLAGVLGEVLFGDPDAILKFRYFAPPP